MDHCNSLLIILSQAQIYLKMLLIILNLIMIAAQIILIPIVGANHKVINEMFNTIIDVIHEKGADSSKSGGAKTKE